MSVPGKSKSVVLRGSVPAPVSTGAGASHRQTVSHAGNYLPSSRQKQLVSAEHIDEIVADVSRYIDKSLRRVRGELYFIVDRANAQSVIAILDSQTDEIVRRISRQELIEMRRQINANPDGLIRGLLFSDEA